MVQTNLGGPFALNHTFTFGNGTRNWIKVLTLTVSSSGALYTFKQWSRSNGAQWDTNANMTTPLMVADYTFGSVNGGFIAQFDKQFQLTLSFSDTGGQAVNPPSSVTLTPVSPSGLSQVALTPSQYSNHWLSAAVWQVTDSTWEGTPGVVSGQQSIDLTTGPVTATVGLLVYTAAIKLIDNSNNPVAGATVTVNFPTNGTTTAPLTSDGQGMVNLGSIPVAEIFQYNAHITYHGQQWDYSVASSAPPTHTIQLSIAAGGVNAPVVSAVVLLTIFGIALFLIVLAVRVRKPPPPPMIG